VGRFDNEYKIFKLKCENFLEQIQFKAQYEEDLKIKQDIDSIKDEELSALNETNPKFLEIHNSSVETISKIIKLREELLKFFEMPKEHIERKYKTVPKADKYVRGLLVKIEEQNKKLDTLNDEATTLVQSSNILDEIQKKKDSLSS
jgi:hypothetical protein